MHLASHVQDLVHSVTTVGLNGCWHSQQWLHPAFCPFCLYDVETNRVDRYKTLNKLSYTRHLATHLQEEGLRPCPITAATPEGLPQCLDTRTFDSVQLAKHLIEAHDMSDVCVPQEKQNGPPPKKQKRSTTTDRAPLADRDANQQPPHNDGKRI